MPELLLGLNYYLAVINILAFLAMGWDKFQAQRKGRRLRKKTLWLLALAGGALGGLIGMQVWCHKTRHLAFTIFVPLLALFQAAAFFWFGY